MKNTGRNEKILKIALSLFIVYFSFILIFMWQKILYVGQSDKIIQDIEEPKQATSTAFEITLNINGGTAGNSVVSLYYKSGESVVYTDENCTKSYAIGSQVVEIPTKFGNRFLGYYVNSTQLIDENGKLLSYIGYLGNSYKSDVTATAKWEKVSVITINTSGGTSSVENLFYISGSANANKVYLDSNCTKLYTIDQTIPNIVPSKVGYNFLGYYGTYNGTEYQIIDENGVLTSNYGYFSANGVGDVTIIARWKARIIYTITLDANGGTDNISKLYYISGDTKKVYTNTDLTNYFEVDGDEITNVVPVKTGYTFLGYYYTYQNQKVYIINENGVLTSNRAMFESIGVTNVTIKADWQVNTYTLTIDPNGATLTYDSTGTGVQKTTTSALTRTFTYGTAYVFASTNSLATNTLNGHVHVSNALDENGKYSPKKDGYIFNGWKITLGSGNISNEDDANNHYMYTYDGSYAGNVTIQAQWKKILKVTLDNQDATTAGTAYVYRIYGTQKIYTDENCTKAITSGKQTEITLPTKTGYTFDGYYYTYNSTDYVVVDSEGKFQAGPLYMNSSEVSIKAKWTANTYTLTYNYNGATGGNSTASKSVTYGGTYGTLPAPTRTGYTVTFNANGGSACSNQTSTYTFGGWYKETGYTNKLISTTTVNTANNHTIYAKWTGGSITLPTPTKAGYTFKGWAASTTATSGSTGSYTPTSDVTLYAVWEANKYEIELNINGGTAGNSVVSLYYKSGETDKVYTDSNCTKEYSVGTQVVEVPTKKGYKFLGYYVENDGISNAQLIDENGVLTNVIGYLSSNIKSNTSAKAEWGANKYNLIYNYDKATGGNSLTNKEVTYESTYEDLPTPTREHVVTYKYNGATGGNQNESVTTVYTFVGWYLDEELSDESQVTSITTVTIASDHTIYAGWKDGEITLPEPTREGYTFEGWYKDEECTSKVGESGEEYAPEEDIILYAKWTANTYTIRYDGNGSTSGSMSNSTHTYDTAKKLTANSYLKTGYTFRGWSTSKTGEVVHANEANVTNLTTTNGKTVTLYAIWKANTNTAYKVNIYQMNTSGTYPTTATSTKSLTGTTDAILTYATMANTYLETGFTYAYATLGTSTTKELGTTTTILGDGSRIINLYYSRNKYMYTLGSGANVSTTGSTQTGSIYYGATITLKATANVGYTFSKWTSSTASLQADIATANATFTMPAGILKITPSVTENTYEIKFDSNGGTGNMSNINNVKYTQTVQLQQNSFERTGYTFKGWSLSSSGTSKYEEQATVSKLTTINEGTVTLYAVWEINSSTLVINPNGGIWNNSNIEQSFKQNYLTTKEIEQPTREGYTFNGWKRINENGTITRKTENTIVYTFGPNKDVTDTITAQWTPNVHTIKFIAGDTVVSEFTKEYDAILQTSEFPEVPEKGGYTGSWNVTSNIKVDGDITVSAIYIPKTNIAYKVEHYKQNKELNGYQLAETEEFTGTTEELITATSKAYTGFTYNKAIEGTVESGNISGDGSLVLKLYYNRNKYTVTFKDGENIVKTEEVAYENNATAPEITKAGYTLSWNKEFTNITSSIEVNTVWTANGDTKYKVEHYKQNKELNGYELAETEEFTGTTEELVTATSKEYTGFTYDGSIEGTVVSGNISGDGSLVLKLYYNRNKYTVTFKDGENIVKTEEVAYENNATAPEITKTGYTLGWDKEITNITTSIEVNAVWEANKNTKYKVEHYKQNKELNGYELSDTEEFTGTTDTTATVITKQYTGFTYDESIEGTVASGNINGDESLVLKVYYNRNKYEVIFKDGENVVKTEEVAYENNATAPEITKVGYTLSWDKTYTEITKSIEVNTLWTANGDTKYKVEHYKQNKQLNGYDKYEVEELTGTTDTTATAIVKQYTGFTYDENVEETVVSGNINGDGSLVLKLYYTRNSYVITFDVNSGNEIENNQKAIKYEEEYGELPEATKEGYTFEGWYTSKLGGEKVATTTVNNKAEDHTLYARWTINKYTLTVNPNEGLWNGYTTSTEYTQNYGTTIEIANPTKGPNGYIVSFSNINGNSIDSIIQTTSFSEWKLDGKGSLEGTTYTYGAGNAILTAKYEGNSIVLPIATREGYTFIGWYNGDTYIGTAGDKFTPTQDMNLTAKWEANTYKVTFDANGGIVNPGTKKVTYASTYETLPVPTRKGCVFDGWYDSTDDLANKITESTIVEKTENHTLYAKWIDTEPPNIYISDSNVYSMKVFDEKPKFEAEATDNYDGNVDVIITDDIDVNVAGKYTVTFTAIDATGNYTTETREFEVIYINVDIDKDGKPDVNIDIDDDGKADINIDIDQDGKADINIDTDRDGQPDVNIDTDQDGKADVDIDTNNDGEPDVNIDINGDGKADINIDTDGDGKADINIDTDGDGKADINIDTDGDENADINIDTDGDGEPDINVDINGDGKADINIDTDGDRKADLDIDTDGDKNADTNIDTDNDGTPDTNIEGSEDDIIETPEDVYVSDEDYTASTIYTENGITVASDKYLFGTEYLENVNPKTSVAAFKTNCETADVVEVYDPSGIMVMQDSTYIGTGMKIKVTNEEKKEQIVFNVVVKGDTTGDGTVTTADIAKMKFHILRKITLEGTEFRAADIGRDKMITGKDLATAQRKITNLTGDPEITLEEVIKEESITENAEEKVDSTQQNTEEEQKIITDETLQNTEENKETITEESENTVGSENKTEELTETPAVENTEEKKQPDETEIETEETPEGEEIGSDV